MQDIPKETLIKAQKDDLESFENIYKETSGFVYNVAFRIVNNKQDAEEVVQDVFLNIYHSLKNFRFQSSFKTWVYRITINCAINHVKKIVREKNRIKEYGNNFMQTGETSQMPEVEKVNEGQKEIISSLLGVLDVDQRACIVLRNIEGLSYQEISDTLKININTVRTRLKRARERLLDFGKEALKNEL
jgi:RNA polymerase sigma-70 factor (ECF subfamily)